jgi:hypothetical protein
MKKGEERMHPLFRLLAAGTLLFGALFANFTAQAQPVCRATRSPDVMQAMFAPAGTPKSIIDLLQKEVAKAVAAADVKSKLDSLGFEAIADTPERFAARIKAEVPKWAKVIEAAKIEKVK